MIELGIWYDCESPLYKQLKLIPSQRTLESQDPNIKYFKVIARNTTEETLNSKVVDLLVDSRENCENFMIDIYHIQFLNSTDYVFRLIVELCLDVERNKKGVFPKEWETACHIEEVIRVLTEVALEVEEEVQ